MSNASKEPSRADLFSNKSYVIDDTLFIPVYATFLVKGIRDMDTQKGSYRIEYTLLLRFGVQDLPEEVIKAIRKKLEFRINEQTTKIGEGNEGVNVKN